MTRRRYLLVALAALAVPLPAKAIVSNGSTPPALTVSASLDECGVASTTVVCKLDASFAPIPDARYYTASVTGPDGSVVDYGNVPSGAASLWVPYVGNGTYTVTVSAWGVPVKDHKPKPLDTDTANTSEGEPVAPTSNPGADPKAGDGKAASARTAHAGNAGAVPGQSSSAGDGSNIPAGVTPTKPENPVATPPPDCTATPPPPVIPDQPDSSGDSGDPNALPDVAGADRQGLESQGVLPTYTQSCTDPSDTDPCCPAP